MSAPVHSSLALSTGVYFALYLSLMVANLLKMIFITHTVCQATTQPQP